MKKRLTVHSNPVGSKERYQQERDQLLEVISEHLEADAGVKAAWLFGSLGRGDGDAFSDIDLWVVGEQDHIDRVNADPLRYVSQIEQPILSLEAPQNAPEGGVYFMACYDALTAPHIVDWYWQPVHTSYIPSGVHLLFDKVGIIHEDRSVQFRGQTENNTVIEQPHHFISFFWMMLMITAKQVYRNPWANEMELLPYVLDPFYKTRDLLEFERNGQALTFHSHHSPLEKIQLLSHLADKMSGMMKKISDMSIEVPMSVIPGARRYLSLIELCLIANGNNKDHGC
jgi:predicted nucleotidyltransferase